MADASGVHAFSANLRVARIGCCVVLIAAKTAGIGGLHPEAAPTKQRCKCAAASG